MKRYHKGQDFKKELNEKRISAHFIHFNKLPLHSRRNFIDSDNSYFIHEIPSSSRPNWLI